MMRRRISTWSLAAVSLALLGWMQSAARAADSLPPPLPTIPQRQFRVTDYGAIGDGKTDNTAALQKTISLCIQAGGGTVDVPPGRFLTKPFTLASSLNLHTYVPHPACPRRCIGPT